MADNKRKQEDDVKVDNKKPKIGYKTYVALFEHKDQDYLQLLGVFLSKDSAKKCIIEECFERYVEIKTENIMTEDKTKTWDDWEAEASSKLRKKIDSMSVDDQFTYFRRSLSDLIRIHILTDELKE
jgi:hypothetical protein